MGRVERGLSLLAEHHQGHGNCSQPGSECEPHAAGGCRLAKQVFERDLENKQRLFKDLLWTNKAGWEKLVKKMSRFRAECELRFTSYLIKGWEQSRIILSGCSTSIY